MRIRRALLITVALLSVAGCNKEATITGELEKRSSEIIRNKEMLPMEIIVDSPSGTVMRYYDPDFNKICYLYSVRTNPNGASQRIMDCDEVKTISRARYMLPEEKANAQVH